MEFARKNPVWIFFLTFCIMCTTNNAQSSCIVNQSPISRLINHLSDSVTNAIGGNENYFFSPLSISLAMGMVYLGAKGDTADEIRNALGYDLLGNITDEDIHLYFHTFLTNLGNGGDEYHLLAANSIFTQVGFEVLKEYSKNLGLYYHAQQESLDFANDGIAAMNSMNNWVSENTRGKIPQLFTTPVDTMTVMVLLNTVYFKGTWKYPFDFLLNLDRNFYGINGTKVIPFMRQTKSLKYYSDRESGFDFVELLYTGGHVSMIIALPKSHNHTSLELSTETFCRIKSNLRRELVELNLPRFKLSYDKELSGVLKGLGINSAFREDTANFTGIRMERDIWISLIKHKAVIEVNELGSEAAATTGVIFQSRSGTIIRKEFDVNRPFLLFILHKKSGSILFKGRISDPYVGE